MKNYKQSSQKSLKIVFMLAILISVSHCQRWDYIDSVMDMDTELTAYSKLTAVSGLSNPSPCFVTLEGTATTDSMNFVQTVYPSACAKPAFVMTSFFEGDTTFADTELLPTPSASGGSTNMAQWNLNLANITQMNGTACVRLKKRTENLKYFLCKMKVGGVSLYFQAFILGSASQDKFDTHINQFLMPSLANTVKQEDTNYLVSANSNFTDIPATLTYECDKPQIGAALDDRVFLQFDQGENISALGKQLPIVYVLVKHRDAVETGNYSSVWHSSICDFCAKVQSKNNCYRTSLTFKDLNDEINCTGNGCLISLIVYDYNGNFVVVKTQGFVYDASNASFHNVTAPIQTNHDISIEVDVNSSTSTVVRTALNLFINSGILLFVSAIMILLHL